MFHIYIENIYDHMAVSWNALICIDPVDTVFGHVSFDTCLELLKFRSADGANGD